ncbi:SRPBCC domain-containing protein [Rugamonas sp. CCM 8940]|uniref:SRPBCC family protein n=1 Tax=Rugamonas sp. CCM 8940 TaxID=2765359 RepID=UPI0018F71E31|nr:hypothetical protein [Rugamonas sp. CCM 8940]MBJ7309577.1 hypothetical protein [Rugamonas sp. CCM 8940]
MTPETDIETETAKLTNAAAAGLSGRELTITRLFDASLALVFQAWVQPGHLAQCLAGHLCDCLTRY